jgi:hypothetical protein
MTRLAATLIVALVACDEHKRALPVSSKEIDLTALVPRRRVNDRKGLARVQWI